MDINRLGKKGIDAKVFEDLRYEIGDLLGDRAPDAFRRSTSWSTGLLIGAGSVLFALGVGYVAMKLADRRLERIFDRAVPADSKDASAPPEHESAGEADEESAAVPHTNGAEVAQP